MTLLNLSLVLSILALTFTLALSFYIIYLEKKKPALASSQNYNSIPLQLQAYERLAVLCERIAIPNLISRVSHPQATAYEMRSLLIESIKQEFEYNASQQIYVSKDSWDAVRNLRDQSMLIINKIANLLPEDASSGQLNKKLLEVMINHEDAALHTIVLEALSFEAKKLMQ
ncbi:MAG TPA: hypothetical protein VM935_07915 [Chitinophagaceae bacterium]|jgi:hypothetical protein|nr:hypothetical protein [Chitinophagaceae bacterium]